MGVKIEKELFSPKEKQTLIRLAMGDSYSTVAQSSCRSEATVKNRVFYLHEKIEKWTGTRPSHSNIVLFAVFGRFLTEEEAKYLIESGELHNWRMGV